MTKLKDISGIEIKTGQIVEIKGGFFKSDNGLFKVITSPGDKGWSGSDYWVRRVNKSGTFSKDKGSGQFWPLMITVSSREKSLEAREHNKKNATITVLSEDLQQVKKIREVQEIAKNELISEGAEKVREENGYYKGYKLHDIVEELTCYGLSYEDAKKKIMELYDQQQTTTEPEEAEAEKKQATTEPSAPEQAEENDSLKVEVSYNEEKNGIELKFDGKPEPEVREQLKANSFRWSKYQELWYAKDTPERRAFAECFNGTLTESKPVAFEYPDIDIDDLEDYTIDHEVSKRENNNSMFRSKDRNHNQELQQTLQHYQGQAIGIIEKTDNQEIIYHIKKDLQRFKKAYHGNYISTLTHRANNPSWAVTGRAGRNVRRDQKSMSRYDKLMSESIEIVDNFKESLSRSRNRIRTTERKAMYEKIENTDVKISFNVEQKEISGYSKRTYNYKNYMIVNIWGCFRLFKDGKELKGLRTTDTLTMAKKALQLIVNNESREVIHQAI